jgi:hypothetical protein
MPIGILLSPEDFAVMASWTRRPARRAAPRTCRGRWRSEARATRRHARRAAPYVSACYPGRCRRKSFRGPPFDLDFTSAKGIAPRTPRHYGPAPSWHQVVLVGRDLLCKGLRRVRATDELERRSPGLGVCRAACGGGRSLTTLRASPTCTATASSGSSATPSVAIWGCSNARASAALARQLDELAPGVDRRRC